MKDLVLLVADKNMQFALKGILTRPQAMGIRAVDFEFRTHMGRDGGARTSGAEALALERGRFSHALLLFDLEGSGADTDDAQAVERGLDERIAQHWGERGKAIAISPELDIWVWGADNALRSSALYEQIASRISLKRCHDTAFVRLRSQLQKWFPAE